MKLESRETIILLTGWSNQFQKYESWIFTIFKTYHIVLDEVRLVKKVIIVKKTVKSHIPNLASELVVGSGEHQNIYVMNSCWNKYVSNWIFLLFPLGYNSSVLLQLFFSTKLPMLETLLTSSSHVFTNSVFTNLRFFFSHKICFIFKLTNYGVRIFFGGQCWFWVKD